MSFPSLSLYKIIIFCATVQFGIMFLLVNVSLRSHYIRKYYMNHLLLFYSFQPTVDGSENDMRFIYCACCISYILNDWSGVDIPRVVQYIKKSRVINSFLVNYAF